MASLEARRAAIENARKLVESGVVASQAYTPSFTDGQVRQSPQPTPAEGSRRVLESPPAKRQ